MDKCAQIKRMIGAATTDLDRFMYFSPRPAPESEGWLLTKRVVAHGQTLAVNAHVEGSQSALYVEVLEVGPDLTTRSELVRNRNSVRINVQWPAGFRWTQLNGKTIRLKFYMMGHARLYAFEFI